MKLLLIVIISLAYVAAKCPEDKEVSDAQKACEGDQCGTRCFWTKIGCLDSDGNVAPQANDMLNECQKLDDDKAKQSSKGIQDCFNSKGDQLKSKSQKTCDDYKGLEDCINAAVEKVYGKQK